MLSSPMVKSDEPKPDKGSQKAQREARLAAALRANLRRRKAAPTSADNSKD